MREGADTADATRSGRGYLRMLAVIAWLLTVWLLLFVAFLSSYYSVWREPLGYALMWSAALAALGAGGTAALIGGHRIIGFAYSSPLRFSSCASAVRPSSSGKQPRACAFEGSKSPASQVEEGPMRSPVVSVPSAWRVRRRETVAYRTGRRRRGSPSVRTRDSPCGDARGRPSASWPQPGPSRSLRCRWA